MLFDKNFGINERRCKLINDFYSVKVIEQILKYYLTIKYAY
jgi:hypothetical protein